MKRLLLLAVLGWSCSSFAWISKDAPEKTYTFKFQYRGESLEVRKPANSYEDAFEQAADTCFRHFKGNKAKISEDEGLDIIDVCANPRS